MSVDKFRLYLSNKNHLSRERFLHCLQVERMMLVVAKKLKLNYLHAAMCGLLHDFAREKSIDEMIRVLQETDPVLLKQTPEKCRTEVYLHGPVGAILVKRMWWRDIRSSEVIDAIWQQAGVFPNMSMLTRCLYICKALVPINGSSFPMQRDIQQLLMAGKLDEADLLLTMYIKQHYDDQGMDVHPVIKKRIAELKRRVDPKVTQVISTDESVAFNM